MTDQAVPKHRGGRRHPGAWKAGGKQGAGPDPTSARALRRIPELTHPLWERQSGETPLNYEAFTAYRDLGASRTLVRARELLGKVAYRGASYFDDLSSKYRWTERVTAYDAWLDTILLAAREDFARQQASMWIARETALKEQEYTLGMGLLAKVAEMVKYPITRQTRTKQVSKNGKVIHYTIIIEPAKWDFRAAADILQKSGFQSRLAAGMVTDGARAPTPEVTAGGLADIDAWLKEVGIPADEATVEVDG